MGRHSSTTGATRRRKRDAQSSNAATVDNSAIHIQDGDPSVGALKRHLSSKASIIRPLARRGLEHSLEDMRTKFATLNGGRVTAIARRHIGMTLASRSDMDRVRLYAGITYGQIEDRVRAELGEDCLLSQSVQARVVKADIGIGPSDAVPFGVRVSYEGMDQDVELLSRALGRVAGIENMSLQPDDLVVCGRFAPESSTPIGSDLTIPHAMERYFPPGQETALGGIALWYVS